VSQLKLTPRGFAALKQRRPTISTTGFSFLLSASATVEVTLVKETISHTGRRWAPLPASLKLNAAKGRVSHNLTDHNRLSPGRYRLTVKALTGSSRSIFLDARR
jgi:hypothetical protein